MNVAITIWDKRVSPVFDSSQTLLIASVSGRKVTSRHIEPFDSGNPFRLVDRLHGLKIGVLICGAISTQPADVIESRGIQLIPFVCGNADDVLTSFVQNLSVGPEFLLPGCGGKPDSTKPMSTRSGTGRRGRKQRLKNESGRRHAGK